MKAQISRWKIERFENTLQCLQNIELQTLEMKNTF